MEQRLAQLLFADMEVSEIRTHVYLPPVPMCCNYCRYLEVPRLPTDIVIPVWSRLRVLFG
jgi:hypothetical protein